MFCVLFLFSCLLFWSLVMVPVCVMLPFPSCLLAIGSSVQCVMFWLVVLVMCLVSHWFVHVMWPSLFVISSHVVALFLVVYWSCNLLLVSLVCLSMDYTFEINCTWVLTTLASSGLNHNRIHDQYYEPSSFTPPLPSSRWQGYRGLCGGFLFFVPHSGLQWCGPQRHFPFWPHKRNLC